MSHTTILISGASIAGPALAYWLRRRGFHPTIVERAPAIRPGGQAIDVRGVALDVVERMGLLAAVQSLSTRMRGMSVVDADGRELMRTTTATLTGGLVGGPDVELMRDDLAGLLHAATRDDVEYVFDDAIVALTQDDRGVDVRFARGEPRRFDLVIGADGLHSNVRRLAFGDEARYTHHVGAYLAVVTLPNWLGLSNHSITYGAPGRMAALYSAPHMPDARAVFLWRSPPLDVHHRDTARQKQLLREAFAGLGWQVPRILAELDDAPAFYFDAITQLRMDTWSRGRISLCGDAGYCPGPAVGGSTSLAVVGAYVLAGELAAAAGDHTRAFDNCERALGPYVHDSRAFALRAARNLIPTSRFALWAQTRIMWLLGRAPTRLARVVANLTSAGVRMHDSVVVPDYGLSPAKPVASAA
jgi:2-polyprenyl-6-methoxyphenol hydroxylase-like FAD-dependent oxidoreductase